MKSKSVEMFELTVPLKAVEALSPEQRHAYYLLGHIFNELLFLRKIVTYTFPRHGDTRDARTRAEMGQMFCACRIAASKVWEAKLALDKKSVSRILRDDMLPLVENGIPKWKALQALIRDAEWLVSWRNVIGFHFPSFEEWNEAITPRASWVDDKMYFGALTGNTYFHGSESIAQAWMFEQYDGPLGMDSARERVIQLIKLINEMYVFLEEVLSTYVARSLIGGKPLRRSVGLVTAPLIDEVRIPFWIRIR